MSDALQTLMRSARRRSALAASVAAAARGLGVGAAALLALALGHRFVASASASVAALLLLLPIALALATSWRGRPSSQRLAAAIDERFGTCSLFASAWATRDAPTPAARIVLADAQARARDLHARIPSLWPVRFPRSLAPSAAAVFAATLLLVQPGASARSDRGVPVSLAATERALTPETAPIGSTRGPDSAHPIVPASRVAGDNEDRVGDDSRAGARAGDDGRVAAVGSSDAGDAPGRATGTTGAQAARDLALSTRWQERARRANGTVSAGVPDSNIDVAMPDSSRDVAAATIAAAKIEERPYEPALAPALAAFVNAAARESGR